MIAIRPVVEDDAPSIVELLRPLIAAGTHTVMEDVTPDDQLQFIREFPERGSFLAAVREDDGQILGIQDVLCLHPEEPVFDHVGSISTFVAVGAWRRGVGSRLLEATFDLLPARGFSKVMAMVRSDNPGARAFYESQGFRVVGTVRKHACFRGQFIDEVLLERLMVG